MYKEIKLICDRKDLQMKDIADKLNISESYLYKILSGDRANKKRIKDISDLIYSETDILPIFKNHVKSKCREKDITLKQLSSELQISLSYLYDILNGRRRNELLKKKLKYFAKEGELPQ